jgi:lysophospholipase L1-like esterase
MPTLHIVGDSISMQYGPWLEKFLANTAWRYSRKEGPVSSIDHGGGANGGDSSHVLGYLRDCAAAKRHWDLLIVNCGLHDIKTDPVTKTRQVSDAHYRDHLEAIVALAPTLADRLLWIRTTPVVDAVHQRHSAAFHRHHADQQRVNAIAGDVMLAHAIPAIDLDHVTRALATADGNIDHVFCDHVHFTDPVRQIQAACIAGWLTADLA